MSFLDSAVCMDLDEFPLPAAAYTAFLKMCVVVPMFLPADMGFQLSCVTFLTSLTAPKKILPIIEHMHYHM